MGSLGLTTLLGSNGLLSSTARAEGVIHPLSPKSPQFPGKAKRVIHIFANGGPSHVDTFDPKPALDRWHGKEIPVHFATERKTGAAWRSPFRFRRYGQSGMEISDFFPHTARNADRIAVVRSMWTTDSNHGAQTQFHSGRHQNDGDFPTLGAWVHYGLGTLNEDLPQFISMGNREYWNKKDGHYLGPAHDAVPLRIDPNAPLDFGKPERALDPQAQAIGADLVRELNLQRGLEYPNDPALAARIASYELAFRMQRSIPEVVDFAKETAETQALYGIDQPHSRDFGMQLLASRRLVERGVRFIQIQHGAGGAGTWDAHGGLKANHENNAKAVDQPIAGLLIDLERRGLLKETLVVFATEFGRTPGAQGSDGRDHHIFGFSVWLAGGSIRGGMVHGSTDEIGFHASEDRHYVTDVHATILEQLGLDSRRLEIPGRKRLEIDHGRPISAIIG
jgi:hypothetical protein